MTFTFTAGDGHVKHIFGPCYKCGTEQTFSPFVEKKTPSIELLEVSATVQSTYYRYMPVRCLKCNAVATSIWVHARGPHYESTIGHYSPQELAPTAPPRAAIPVGVEATVEGLFREAETCIGVLAKRASAALLRATVEQVLKNNGYNEAKVDLKTRIETAAKEGLLTVQLKVRAHNCRAIGNDSLHDGWEPSEAEVQDAYEFVKLLVESFYKTRPEVVAELRKLKRIP